MGELPGGDSIAAPAGLLPRPRYRAEKARVDMIARPRHEG